MELWIWMAAASAILCAVVAGIKGRSAVGWLVAGLLFGVFALMAVVCLSKLSTDDSETPIGGF